MQTLKNLIKEFRELRSKADSGLILAEVNEWSGNENLKHWVNSNRHDETHTHGDGIGCFIKYGDALFFEKCANNITKLLDAMEVLIEALEKVEKHFCACSIDDEIIPQVEARQALQQADEKVRG